jgi:hypothetical protein
LGFAAAGALAIAGCGGDDDNPPQPDSGQGNPDAGAGTPDGGSGLTWTPLITAEWTLAAHGENTSDVHQMTLDRDIYVGAIRPIDPPGTHHTVLARNGLSAGGIVYASGVGTNEIVFPEGVGLKLNAGDDVILQLHLFNTSDDTMTGTSGIEIVEVDAADVQYEANLHLPGPFGFQIPPQQTYTFAGTCTLTEPQTIFAVFPHMHQLGVHFKATLNVGGVDMVLHDDDYAFDDQAFIPFEPIVMNPGDTITSECTWNNTTDQTVMWGESSTSEMCFSILYRYPAISGTEFCFN